MVSRALWVTTTTCVICLAYFALALYPSPKGRGRSFAAAVFLGALYIIGVLLWASWADSERSAVSPSHPPSIIVYLADGFDITSYVVTCFVCLLLYMRRHNLVYLWCLGVAITSTMGGIGNWLLGAILLMMSPPYDPITAHGLLPNMFITGVFYGFFFGPGITCLAHVIDVLYRTSKWRRGCD
jgi:hypothetical protein